MPVHARIALQALQAMEQQNYACRALEAFLPWLASNARCVPLGNSVQLVQVRVLIVPMANTPRQDLVNVPCALRRRKIQG